MRDISQEQVRVSKASVIKEFRDLDKNQLLSASVILASHVVQILLSMYAGYLLISLNTALGYLGLFALTLFIGTRYRALNNIVHECSHFAFTENRKHNEFIGSLSAAFLLKSFSEYRREHMSHHSHLGDFEKDLDFKNISEFHADDQINSAMILRHVLTPIVGLHLPKYVSVNLSISDGFGFALIKMALTVGALAWLIIDPLTAILLYFIPFFWAFSAINYWTDCIDHGGLLQHDDELMTSRNFIVPRWLRLILFPRNDCFHLVHHLFPTVPVKHFDHCHSALSEYQYYERDSLQNAQRAT